MKLIFNVFVWLLLPIVAIAVSTRSMTATVSQPPAVALVAAVDSGERWWNPSSWSLDESALQAVNAANLAANAAQANAINYTSALTNMLVMGLLIATAITAFVQRRDVLTDIYATAVTKWEAAQKKLKQELAEAEAAAQKKLKQELAEAESFRKHIPDEISPSAADIAKAAQAKVRHPAAVS